ncbi:MAG: hypothetical protein NTX59_11640 [Elusimicrobia bacterium]|nr:hypothetical protein [Elusimicrobiota bacterium]
MQNNFKGRLFFLTLAGFFIFAAGSPSRAQQAPAKAGGISRSMEQAIRLYHEGQDNEAMDRFIEILTKGTPSEKSLANEYITKITLRMNTGVGTLKDRGPDTGGLSDVEEVKQTQVKKQFRSGESAGADENAETDDADARVAQKERVSEKISAKIAEMRRSALLELGRYDSVKIYMGDDLPKAITINPSALFANETVFKPNTAPVLSNLAGLIFTLGKANCLILPEGSAQNDVKIKSIRQALALNSYLVSRGLSPARIDVNLTGADVKFPKELTNISGLIILFSYGNAQRLMDTEEMSSRGPKVSLGIFPTSIATRNNEGAIVEFSVFAPPAGTPSWKFQIYQVQKDNSLLPLQEISGAGAQYNQSFWNARKNFFGAAYPSGKYLFSMTAADVEGRENNVRRLLVVKPAPGEEAALQAAPVNKKAPGALAAPKTKAGKALKKSSLKTGKALLKNKPSAHKTGAALKASKAGKKSKTAAAALKKKSAAAKAAKPSTETETLSSDGTSSDGASSASTEAAGNGDTQAPGSGQVSYKIYFKENSATVTANSEKKLSQVAETLNYYPMSKIKLTGYAYSGEPNADTMAENRVNYVVSRLTEKYKIDKERLDSQTKISDTPKTLVEIKLVGKE